MKQIISKAKSGRLLFWALLTACSSRHAGFLEENPFTAHREVNVLRQSAANGHPALRIVFTGNLHGYLGPCGCSVNPKGGIDRRWNALSGLRKEFLDQGFSKEQFLIFDAGNALFENRRLDPTRRQSELRRVQRVQRAQKEMGVMVQNVGINDLAMGYKFLAKDDTRFGRYLSSNLVTAKQKAAFQEEWRSPANKILVLGFTEAGALLPEGLVALDPLPILRKKLDSLPPDYSVVILSDLGQKNDRALAEAVDFPLLIIGAREPSSLEIPVVVGKSILVQTQVQGQQWGIVDWVRPAERAQGWFSPQLGERFYRRWVDLAAEEKVKAQIKSADERDYEFDKLEAVAGDLRGYAPGDVTKKNLYDYRLLDMTTQFQGRNAMSAILKEAGLAH